jgi:hypothetical protein
MGINPPRTHPYPHVKTHRRVGQPTPPHQPVNPPRPAPFVRVPAAAVCLVAARTCPARARRSQEAGGGHLTPGRARWLGGDPSLATGPPPATRGAQVSRRALQFHHSFPTSTFPSSRWLLCSTRNALQGYSPTPIGFANALQRWRRQYSPSTPA